MTTNQNTNAAADSTSKAKTIGGTDTTHPGSGVEEAELSLRSTLEQEIRTRAYEIYHSAEESPATKRRIGFRPNVSLANHRPITPNKEYQ
jgi:hypothetical protein